MDTLISKNNQHPPIVLGQFQGFVAPGMFFSTAYFEEKSVYLKVILCSDFKSKKRTFIDKVPFTLHPWIRQITALWSL